MVRIDVAELGERVHVKVRGAAAELMHEQLSAGLVQKGLEFQRLATFWAKDATITRRQRGAGWLLPRVENHASVAALRPVHDDRLIHVTAHSDQSAATPERVGSRQAIARAHPPRTRRCWNM